MKKNSILMLAFLIVFTFGFQTASAQITINIPGIPEIKKPKKEQPKETQTTITTTSDNQTSQSKLTTQSSNQDSDSSWLSAHLENIKKKQKEVDAYNPADKEQKKLEQIINNDFRKGGLA